MNNKKHNKRINYSNSLKVAIILLGTMGRCVNAGGYPDSNDNQAASLNGSDRFFNFKLAPRAPQVNNQPQEGDELVKKLQQLRLVADQHVTANSPAQAVPQYVSVSGSGSYESTPAPKQAESQIGEETPVTQGKEGSTSSSSRNGSVIEEKSVPQNTELASNDDYFMLLCKQLCTSRQNRARLKTLLQAQNALEEMISDQMICSIVNEIELHKQTDQSVPLTPDVCRCIVQALGMTIPKDGGQSSVVRFDIGDDTETVGEGSDTESVEEEKDIEVLYSPKSSWALHSNLDTSPIIPEDVANGPHSNVNTLPIIPE